MPLKFRKSLLIHKWRSSRQVLTTFKITYKVSVVASDNMLRLVVVGTPGVLSVEVHHVLLKNQSLLLSRTPPC